MYFCIMNLRVKLTFNNFFLLKTKHLALTFLKKCLTIVTWWTFDQIYDCLCRSVYYLVLLRKFEKVLITMNLCLHQILMLRMKISNILFFPMSSELIQNMIAYYVLFTTKFIMFLNETYLPLPSNNHKLNIEYLMVGFEQNLTISVLCLNNHELIKL